MKGRKPTPTALKLIQGNPGKRPLNTNEPQPAPGIPDCPPSLSGEAKAEWGRWIAALEPTRMLTQADRTALAALCEAWAILQAASADIECHGSTVFVLEKDFEDGTTLYAKAAVNPAVSSALKAAAVIRSLASEFGGTPSARSRLQGPAKPNQQDKADLLSS